MEAITENFTGEFDVENTVSDATTNTF